MFFLLQVALTHSKLNFNRPQMVVSGSADASVAAQFMGREIEEANVAESYNVTYYTFDENLTGPLQVTLKNTTSIIAFYGYGNANHYYASATNVYTTDSTGSEIATTSYVVKSNFIKTVTNWFFMTTTERAEVARKTKVTIGVSFPLVFILAIGVLFLQCFCDCLPYSTDDDDDYEPRRTTSSQLLVLDAPAASPPPSTPPPPNQQEKKEEKVPESTLNNQEIILQSAAQDPYAEDVPAKEEPSIPVAPSPYAEVAPVETQPPEVDPADDW